jgi:hypothetical protein
LKDRTRPRFVTFLQFLQAAVGVVTAMVAAVEEVDAAVKEVDTVEAVAVAEKKVIKWYDQPLLLFQRVLLHECQAVLPCAHLASKW